MALAVHITASEVAIIPSTLVTSVLTTEDAVLEGRGGIIGSDHLSPFEVRDTIVQTAWVTIVETRPENTFQGTQGPLVVSTDTVALQISIPSLAAPQPSPLTSVAPVATSNLDSSAAARLGVDTLVGSAPQCPLNTAPLDQQRASYEECQRTVAPGEICCIPFAADPSNLPNATASTAPASAPASPTVVPPSSSSTTSPSLVVSTPPATSPSSSATPSTDPLTQASVPAPMPTEVTLPRHRTPILPILIPCALAAVGIVACAIWCTMWRSREQRHRLPPSVDLEPKVINEQRVLGAGNFTMAEAFESGVEEMERKEKVGREGRGGWKAGYRKYRESGTGSGLFGKSP